MTGVVLGVDLFNSMMVAVIFTVSRESCSLAVAATRTPPVQSDSAGPHAR